MKSVFISHDSQNRIFAADLARSLEERGIKSFLAGNDLRADSNWLEVLKCEVQTADGFILVMPAKTAKSSNNSFFETGVARAFGKVVIVVVPDIQDVDQSNIPLEIANTVIVDAAKKSLTSVADTVAGAVQT